MRFTYDFAVKLADAGFPAKHYMESYTRIKEPFDIIPCPSLDNFVSACGDWLTGLTRDQKTWYATGSKGTVSYKEKGDTPEEALANLWLKLNNK